MKPRVYGILELNAAQQCFIMILIQNTQMHGIKNPTENKTTSFFKSSLWYSPRFTSVYSSSAPLTSPCCFLVLTLCRHCSSVPCPTQSCRSSLHAHGLQAPLLEHQHSRATCHGHQRCLCAGAKARDQLGVTSRACPVGIPSARAWPCPAVLCFCARRE